MEKSLSPFEEILFRNIKVLEDKSSKKFGTVLVLDQSGMSSLYITEILRSKGILVENAADVKHANELLEEKNYDFYLINSRLSPICFSREQVDKSKGGRVTGLIWYNNLDESLKKPVIFYSQGDNAFKLMKSLAQKNKFNYIPLALEDYPVYRGI